MQDYIRYSKVSHLKRYWKDYEYAHYKEYLKYSNFWKHDVILDNFDKLFIAYIPYKFITHFQSIISVDEYNFCVDCGLGFICGYMLLYRKEYKKINQYIELTDTIIPKLNILENMIKHYQDKCNVKLHPKETIEYSNMYWIKFYKKNYNIYTKEDYIEFCNKEQIALSIDLQKYDVLTVHAEN
jgi:hypothetical protein